VAGAGRSYQVYPRSFRTAEHGERVRDPRPACRLALSTSPGSAVDALGLLAVAFYVLPMADFGYDIARPTLRVDPLVRGPLCPTKFSSTRGAGGRAAFRGWRVIPRTTSRTTRRSTPVFPRSHPDTTCGATKPNPLGSSVCSGVTAPWTELDRAFFLLHSLNLPSSPTSNWRRRTDVREADARPSPLRFWLLRMAPTGLSRIDAFAPIRSRTPVAPTNPVQPGLERADLLRVALIPRVLDATSRRSRTLVRRLR